jgi:hypothetical protein
MASSPEKEVMGREKNRGGCRLAKWGGGGGALGELHEKGIRSSSYPFLCAFTVLLREVEDMKKREKRKRRKEREKGRKKKMRETFQI